MKAGGYIGEYTESIGEGSSAILVKYDSLCELDSEFIKWLREEGFQSWQHSKGYLCGWVWVNLNSKVYAKGIPGIKIVSSVGEHAVTADEFKTIWSIYKKYEGLEPLVME